MNYGMNRRGNTGNQIAKALKNELVKRAVPAVVDGALDAAPKVFSFFGEYATSFLDIRLENAKEVSRIKREKEAFAWEMEKKAMSAQAAQAEHECTIVNFKDYCNARA